MVNHISMTITDIMMPGSLGEGLLRINMILIYSLKMLTSTPSMLVWNV
jgi:hypothetical protein